MIPYRRKVVKDHWDKLIPYGPERCSVCDKKPKKGFKLHYWGIHKQTGEEMFRHEKCSAGSYNWIKKFNGWVNPEFNKIMNGKSFE